MWYLTGANSHEHVYMLKSPVSNVGSDRLVAITGLVHWVVVKICLNNVLLYYYCSIDRFLRHTTQGSGLVQFLRQRAHCKRGPSYRIQPFPHSQELELGETREQPFRHGHQLVGVQVPGRETHHSRPEQPRMSTRCHHVLRRVCHHSHAVNVLPEASRPLSERLCFSLTRNTRSHAVLFKILT